MKKLDQIIALITLAAALLVVGCQSKLEPGGAYAPATVTVENGQTNVVATVEPDKALFLIDSAADIAKTALDAVFDLERDNRDFFLKISPDIKAALDDLRPKAVDTATRYAFARQAYIAHRTPTGLSTLQRILTEIQRLNTSAQSAISKVS